MNTRKAKIEIGEKDLQWLSGWLEALLHGIPIENVTEDVIRMRSIVDQIDKALLKIENEKKK